MSCLKKKEGFFSEAKIQWYTSIYGRKRENSFSLSQELIHNLNDYDV
jgi:hypothetical protein